MTDSKKRMYTFASGCENIPDKNSCVRAGATHARGCQWDGGRCMSVENFTPVAAHAGERCSGGKCLRWWDAGSSEKFTAQTHDGEACQGGHCLRWWRAK
jgi:hypothetical protein